MENKINYLLEEMGLTQGEVKVYLSLFKLGNTSSGEIVKEAKVHTSKVYPILDRLIDKGLVSYIKEGKKTIYCANSPQMLIKFLEEKELKIEKQKKDAKEMIKELELMKTWEKVKTQASIFKSLKGFENCFENFKKNIKKNDEVLVFCTLNLEKNLERKFKDSLNQLSNKIKICLNEKSKKLNEELLKLKNIKIKKIQESLFIPALIYIHENKIILSVEEGKTTFYIENKEVVESFKIYFKTFWESKTRIYSGNEGLSTVINEIIEAGKKGLPNFGFGTHDNPFIKHVPEEMKKLFESEKKYNIDTKLLFMEGGEHNQPNANVKYLPKEYISPVRTMIYGDSVAIADFSTKPWTTIIIDKAEIAKSFKQYFMTLWNLEVKVYSGIDGAKKVLKDIAQAGVNGEEICGFGTDEDDFLKYCKKELDEYFKLSKKNPFKERLLFGKGFKSPNPTAKIKTLPKGFNVPTRTMIYGDKLAIVDFSEEITTIIIEKKNIVKGYKSYFEYLWSIAK